MKFKLSKSTPEIVLHSTNESLHNRWSVLTYEKMIELEGGSWKWFSSISDPEGDYRLLERTNLTLGYDDRVGRPVIVKVIKYTPSDLQSAEGVQKRRQVLTEQIKLLNEIASPLLPEPLDWFNILNTVDALPEESLAKTEPVLVLDYIPGFGLVNEIYKKKFRRRGDKTLDIPKISRLTSYILYFLRTLYEKGYMYIGLSPEHIVLLKNEIPRFVGLGRICKIDNEVLDSTHINFGRTQRGYSAPELNRVETNFGHNCNAQAVGVFSVGVIFAQLVLEETDFLQENLENGAYKYPNLTHETIIKQLPKGEYIHDLLSQLCHPDPEKRLIDFDEIESKLSFIRGDAIDENSDPIISKLSDRVGKVNYFNQKDKYGYIIDVETREEHSIKRKMIERAKIDSLSRGDIVSFTICERESGDRFIEDLMIKSKVSFDPVVSKLSNRDGKIKFYNSDARYAFVIDEETLEEFVVGRKVLDNCGIEILESNKLVIFSAAKRESGKAYVTHLKVKEQKMIVNTTANVSSLSHQMAKVKYYNAYDRYAYIIDLKTKKEYKVSTKVLERCSISSLSKDEVVIFSATIKENKNAYVTHISLKSENMSTSKDSIVARVSNRQGIIRFYNDRDGYGYVTDSETSNEYRIDKDVVTRCKIKELTKGDVVIFSGTKRESGALNITELKLESKSSGVNVQATKNTSYFGSIVGVIRGIFNNLS